MSEQQDGWLKDALGIDLGQLPSIAAGTGAPPVADPATQTAVVDTVTQFGKGFVKGASDTALGIVNSPGGQLVAGPLGFEQNVLNAAISGDPSKLAPVNLGIPDANTINDPNAQATAVAQAQGLVKSVVDPIGFAKDAAIADATVLVTGDPEKVGEATGKATVIIGTTVAGGIGELGIGETGAATAADAGADAASGLPKEAPAAGDAPGAGASQAVDSNPFAEPFGRAEGTGANPALQPFPELPPVSEPGSGPVTPRVGDAGPISGFDRAIDDLPRGEAPPSGPIDLTPPSALPSGVFDPPTPPQLPAGEGPGAPFGFDPPSTPEPGGGPPPEDP